MAISALMPLLMKGEQITSVEFRGFTRAVVQTQIAASTINPDPHDLVVEGIGAAIDSSREISDAIVEELNPFDAWAGHYQSIAADNDEDDAETRTAKELLRWYPLPLRRVTGSRTPLQNAFARAVRESVRRYLWGQHPSATLLGLNLKAAVMQAARVLNSGFPPLFHDAWWSITPAGIKWDDRPFRGAIVTAYGLSSFNVDLPLDARSLLPHLDRSEELELSYDTLICAHDFRWLASGAFPSKTRPIKGHRADTSEDTLWMMMMAWSALTACASRWDQFNKSRSGKGGRKIGQELGAKRIAMINEENAVRAQRWRELALQRALALRAKHPERPLASLAEAIAGELTLELKLDRPLVPATVYSYLRKSNPALVLTQPSS